MDVQLLNALVAGDYNISVFYQVCVCVGGLCVHMSVCGGGGLTHQRPPLPCRARCWCLHASTPLSHTPAPLPSLAQGSLLVGGAPHTITVGPAAASPAHSGVLNTSSPVYAGVAGQHVFVRLRDAYGNAAVAAAGALRVAVTPRSAGTAATLEAVVSSEGVVVVSGSGV